MPEKTDFYTDIKRSEFRFIAEVGAKPFLLYKYYLTYETAPEIRPTLEATAEDMGMSKSAVCNLNKILIEKGWIRIQNGRIFILKSFRKSERHSENLNANGKFHSENLNIRSENLNNHSENLNERSENLNGTVFAKKEILREKEQERAENKQVRATRARATAPISENVFLKIYQEFYPRFPISIHQQEIIENRIRDPDVWRIALIYWSTNGYRPQSVGKICDRYDEILKGEDGKSNGHSKNADIRAERSRNTLRLADEMEREARSEIARREALRLGNDSDNPQIHLSG